MGYQRGFLFLSSRGLPDAATRALMIMGFEMMGGLARRRRAPEPAKSIMAAARMINGVMNLSERQT